MVCERWEQTSQDWSTVTGTAPPFDVCDKANGITIFVDDTTFSGPDFDLITGLVYAPEITYKYRVVYTSTYSKDLTSNQVIDEFEITFQNKCSTNTVTSGPSDTTYLVMTGAAKVTFLPVFSAGCDYAMYWHGALETDQTVDLDSAPWTNIKSVTSPIDWATLGFTVETDTVTDDRLGL